MVKRKGGSMIIGGVKMAKRKKIGKSRKMKQASTSKEGGVLKFYGSESDVVFIDQEGDFDVPAGPSFSSDSSVVEEMDEVTVARSLSAISEEGLGLGNPVRLCGPAHSTLCVLMLGQDECVLLQGFAKVMSIAGEATVNGYRLHPSSYDEQKMISVCAPRMLGLPASLIGNGSSIIEEKKRRIFWRLNQVIPNAESVAAEYWKDPRNSCLLVLQRKPIPIVEIVGALVEDVLVNRAVRFCAELIPGGPFAPYAPASIKKLVAMMQEVNILSEQGARPCIIPIGEKDAGKSTFVRRLVNHFLSDRCSVYVLDADIGQSEFTPACCISLKKITDPLTGTAFSHQQSFFEHAYLFGDNRLDNVLERYSNIVRHLHEVFMRESEPGSVLVLNTMGYVVDEGAIVLREMLNTIRPEFTVLIGGSPFKVPQGFRAVNIDRCPNNTNMWRAPSRLGAPTMREFSLLGHLCLALPANRPTLRAFCEVAPYKVPFSAITISLFEERYCRNERYTLASLNCALIALGYHETPLENTRRMMEREDFPLIHEDDSSLPAMRILGFGIVRAIDIEKRCFFVITPIPPEQLNRVTVFARPLHMDLPEYVLGSQEGDFIPYLVQTFKQRGANFLHDMYKELQTATGAKRNMHFKKY